MIRKEMVTDDHGHGDTYLHQKFWWIVNQIIIEVTLLAFVSEIITQTWLAELSASKSDQNRKKETEY